MANENKEIGDIVKKCKILLLDIEGTTTSISFVKDKLFPYAEENVKQFLESEWENEDVKEAVAALRQLALEDKEKGVEGHVPIPEEAASKDDQIEGLVKNVKWQMSSDRKVGPLKQLQGLIWKQGYDKGDIKGHVYDDVSSALEQWQSVDGQKIYIYSSGSVQAQKLLFGQSLAGDLLKFIDGHFDTAVGAKQESASYASIVDKIGCKANDILFLTDIDKEAEAAKSAGLNVVLVSREGNAPLTTEATEAFAVIHSFTQLSVSNKRKTEPQDEQPAKIPKTDASYDVKSESETAAAIESEKEEPEKMEVEEESEPVKDATKQEKMKDEPVPVAIEEVCNDVKAPETETKPVITEVKEDKVETKSEEPKEESETMETDSIEKVESSDETRKTEKDETIATTKEAKESIVPEEKTEKEIIEVPKEKSEVNIVENNKPIAKETSSTVITEIEDISDKENLGDMADIVDDIEPVVEEPNQSEDMEELQNVGEVLEKECDEILCKVQDVTNLDNIPLKPLLNPIMEESMETENLDSNDIVERILESEIELEMKQQDESIKKLNEETKAPKNDDETVKNDKTDEKVEVPKDNNEKTESSDIKENKSETSCDSDEKVTEGSVKIEITPEKIETESSPQEKDSVKDNDEKLKPVIEKPVESSLEDKSSDVKVVDSQTDAVTAEEKPKESTTDEAQVNGKTNGEAEKVEKVNQNGDANNDEELSSRLSVENVKEVNGSNGDSTKTENGLEANKVEPEVSDIKVKTVTKEEPRTERIEQPTEA